MCRVKAIASSVERLLRYTNCSGSSESGSTEQMCSLTSFSKHLLKMGVRATGLQSFKHICAGPGASCVPVYPCRALPRLGSRTPGDANRST